MGLREDAGISELGGAALSVTCRSADRDLEVELNQLGARCCSEEGCDFSGLSAPMLNRHLQPFLLPVSTVEAIVPDRCSPQLPAQAYARHSYVQGLF